MRKEESHPCGEDRQKNSGAWMIYSFGCYSCGTTAEVDSRPFSPPGAPKCPVCVVGMDRLYNAQINTSGCKDHDHVPERYRVPDHNRPVTAAGAERKEVAFRRHIERRRSQLREDGGSGALRHTHSVPADLYHAKIRETGDGAYWADPGNLKKHSSTRVSP